MAVRVPWTCARCGHLWEPLAVHQQRVNCPACRHQQRVRLPGVPDRRRKPIVAGPPQRLSDGQAPVAAPPRPPAATTRAEVRIRPAGVPGCWECGSPAAVRLRFHHPRQDLPEALRTGQEHDLCGRHEKTAEVQWMRLVGRFGSVRLVTRHGEP